MTEKTNKKWNDANLATLNDMTGAESVVSAATVEAVAAKLEFSARSVASKLRQLGREVASMAAVKAPTFTAEQSASLAEFVEANAGNLTYKQIAEQFNGGSFTDKQIQGKLLALELTSRVKPADKVEVARTYTPAEEAKFVELANGGSFIEDIATALGKSIESVRGKALSLSRSGAITSIPAQKESHAKNQVDPVDALGDTVATLTVEQIAEKTGKTVRGIKTLLTRRGIKVANYDGAGKKAKAEGKRADA